MGILPSTPSTLEIQGGFSPIHHVTKTQKNIWGVCAERQYHRNATLLRCAVMKRVTIALDDEMYIALLEYAAERSKREMRRFSMGKAIRDLVASQLSTMRPVERRQEFKRESSVLSAD
jgi:predicted transcriptional regulator